MKAQSSRGGKGKHGEKRRTTTTKGVLAPYQYKKSATKGVLAPYNKPTAKKKKK